MSDLDLRWLILTLVQVAGLAGVLGVLGFAYEQAMREKKPFIMALEVGSRSRWLAVSGVVFATGMGFTRAGWGSKAVAIALAMVLIGLAWASSRKEVGYRTKITRQQLTIKYVSKLIVEICIGVLLVLVLAWGINLSWHVVHLYGLAKNLQSDADQIHVDAIVPSIGEAAGDVFAIQEDLKLLFPIFNALRGLPGAGQYLGQVEPLLIYANGLAQAGKEVSAGLQPLLQKTASDLTFPERASQVLQSGQDHFVRALEAIEQAGEVRDLIRPELMPNSIKPLFLKLDANFNLLVAGGQFLQDAPRLLGVGQAQSYLILAQNRDELRATGGFISGIGLLTLQDGKILTFDLGDSYRIDDLSKPYPPPPEALKRFMLADYWLARDANWSPDFPTTAQQAQALYTLSTGVETQGVLAFNQLAVQQILGVIGPVQVLGTDEPVTAANVENYMRQAWAPEPGEDLSQEWWLHRKDFMQLLGTAILEKVLSSPDQGQLLNLAKAIVNLLDQGQVLVYFNDPAAESDLEKSGLDGALHPGNGDYLYLVDSNVGFNKVDSVIKRSVIYQVDLSDLSMPIEKVTLNYQHTGTGEATCRQEASYGSGTYQDMQQRCYLDYWRVYTPAGSELIASNAQSIPADQLLNGAGWPGEVERLVGEAGTNVFAGLQMLPISQSSRIEITYNQPASILQMSESNLQKYSIRVQVQPGLNGLPFQLEIKIPNNASVSEPGEGWKSMNANTWIWQGVLHKSTQLNISFQINP